MSVRCHVYNGTWQDGVDYVEQTKQPFREPKWPVQISSLLQIPMMRVRGIGDSIVHNVSTNQLHVHVRRKSRVDRDGRTINRRLTVPTISQRGPHSLGHVSINYFNCGWCF